MLKNLLPVIAGVASISLVALTVKSPSMALENEAVLVLPRAGLVRALARSHLSLVTDLYWLKTINRTTSATTERDGKALLALAALIVDLDPDLGSVYWFVGLNAPVPPAERGRVWPNSPEAARLMQKGVERFPEDNKLTVALAHNLAFYQRDYLGAARVLEERSKHPDALPYFAQLATRLLATTGQFEASRALARAMLDNAPDDETRAIYEERLKLIDLEQQLTEVDEAAARYKQDRGEYPMTVDDLLKAGYLATAPVCPFGGVIVLRDGKSKSTATKRLRLFERE